MGIVNGFFHVDKKIHVDQYGRCSGVWYSIFPSGVVDCGCEEDCEEKEETHFHFAVFCEKRILLDQLVINKSRSY